jgi:AcrR family transcriptional regulator
MDDMTEDRGGLPPGLALSWGVQPVQRRGPKPAFSVEQIVDTGIEFGDQYGFEAISLQRIAAHLGVTTNALYRYVRSKDELIVLVQDKALGRAPDSILATEGWRAGADAWVRAAVDRYAERPWMLDVPLRGAPNTPNQLHWLEVLLRVLAETSLSQHDALGCAVLLSGYARSYSAMVRELTANVDVPVQAPAVGAFLLPRLQEAGYEMIAALYTNHEYEDEVDDDLDFGLTRILDGIESLLAR